MVALARALISEIRQLCPTSDSLGDLEIQCWLFPYCLLFFEDILDLTEVLFGPSFPTLLGSETARRQKAPGSEYIQVVLSRISPPPHDEGLGLGKAGCSELRFRPKGSAKEGKGWKRATLITQGSRDKQNRNRIWFCLLFAG